MIERRVASRERKTRETEVRVEVDLDGQGRVDIATGLGFFDHLLTQLGLHGFMDLKIKAKGDLEVDAHHTVEDVGIVLGQALAEALGDRQGLRRYGWAMLPMDESLARVAVDVSGRPFLALTASFPQEMVGEFPVCLVKEFLRALTVNAGLTMHLEVTGENSHHMAEALFKALGRSLDQAKQHDSRVMGVPSSKGVL